MRDKTCHFHYIDSVSGERMSEYVLAPVSFVKSAIAEGFCGPDVVVAAELAFARHRKQAVHELAAQHRDNMMVEFV